MTKSTSRQESSNALLHSFIGLSLTEEEKQMMDQDWLKIMLARFDEEAKVSENQSWTERYEARLTLQSAFLLTVAKKNNIDLKPFYAAEFLKEHYTKFINKQIMTLQGMLTDLNFPKDFPTLSNATIAQPSVLLLFANQIVTDAVEQPDTSSSTEQLDKMMASFAELATSIVPSAASLIPPVTPS